MGDYSIASIKDDKLFTQNIRSNSELSNNNSNTPIITSKIIPISHSSIDNKNNNNGNTPIATSKIIPNSQSLIDDNNKNTASQTNKLVETNLFDYDYIQPTTKMVRHIEDLSSDEFTPPPLASPKHHTKDTEKKTIETDSKFPDENVCISLYLLL